MAMLENYLKKKASPIFPKAWIGLSAYVVIHKHMQPIEIQEAFEIVKFPTENVRSENSQYDRQIILSTFLC